MAELVRQRVASAQADSRPLAGSSPAASVRRRFRGTARLLSKSITKRTERGGRRRLTFRCGRTGETRRLLLARSRFESCRRSSRAPVVERAMTPGSQPGSCGFESCRGFSYLAVGRVGHPTGFGHRRSQVRILPARSVMRGRGAAVLASLMSSRSWVRIPPALLGA
jgi:hypothetical protein